MPITFDDKTEALEYKRQMEVEDYIARLYKAGNKFRVELLGTHTDFIGKKPTGKPWLIREMTPTEKRKEKGAWALTGHETKEIIYRHSKEPELLGYALRHEIGHAKFTREELFPEHKMDWDEFKQKYPHKAAQEEFYSEMLANYFALSKVPDDKVARLEIESWRKKSRRAGLSEGEMQRIEDKAKETVGYEQKVRNS